MKAYKGFNDCGFHACEEPLDVFSYYPPASGRYCEVELDDMSTKTSDDSKRCGKRIKIGAEIGIHRLIKAQFDYVKEHTTHEVKNRGAATAGNGGAATAGDRGAATAGYRGAATSKGKSSSGNEGLSVARGNEVIVKGGLGAILIIAEENEDDFKIKDWKAAVVDGENIKADTWYKLVDGEFEEVES